MITICAYDVNNSSYIIQNGRENVDARRKTLAEKARFEYHRTPKNMCCILFTSNAITPYIESHNVSLHYDANYSFILLLKHSRMHKEPFQIISQKTVVGCPCHYGSCLYLEEENILVGISTDLFCFLKYLR